MSVEERRQPQTSPSASLGDVAAATASRRRAVEALEDADDEWRYTIGSAIEGGWSADDVASSAHISAAEAQSICDGVDR